MVQFTPDTVCTYRSTGWQQQQAPVNVVDQTIFQGTIADFGGFTPCMDPGLVIAKILWEISLDCVEADSLLVDTTLIPSVEEFLVTEYKPGGPNSRPESTQSDSLFVIYTCGEHSASGKVRISDAIAVINYIFSGGTAPNPIIAGDAGCNGMVTISNAVHLINYIIAGGALRFVQIPA